METFGQEKSSWSKEEACIELTNHLIVLCNLSFPRVSSLSDITSQLFVLLFEKITGVVPYDLIIEPQNTEDEAHNIQIIIDTLSLDILNISLSHITGEDIVACNALSIYNLLEVLENFILYPAVALEESTTSVREPLVKDKSTNTSNNGHFIVASSEQRLNQNKVQSNGYLQAADLHTDHLSKQDGVSAYDKSLYIDRICPLCTYPNKEATELNSEGKNSMNGKQTEVPLRDSSQSSATAYQKLPERLGEPASLKFLSSGLATSSSSSPHEEQVITESSASISPLAAEHCSGNNILNPKFAKIGLEAEQHNSSKDKVPDPIQPSYPYTSTEFQGLSSGKTSATSVQEPVQPLHSIKSNIPPPEQQIPLPTHSADKFPAKKSVRFVSKKSSRNKKISSESMKRSYNEQNKKYFEERLKNCMDDLESVVESSGFVNNIDDYMFTQPENISSSRPKRSAYLPWNADHNTSPKRIRKVHRRRNTRNIAEQENLISDNQFLQELQREFPYVYLSPASIRRMQQQYRHHLYVIGNYLRDAHQRKPRTQVQYEEAARRKAILSEILQKEIAHNERMRFIREQRQNNQRARAVLRENQQSRAHMKQLCDSYQQYVKQKVMRKRTKEERLLSQLYEDGLSLHKEELRELRKRAKEREEKEAEIHRKYLESMENFYQSQFSMLAESLAVEKQNFQERAKAQARVLDQMRRDYRRQMEEEVRLLQDQLVRDDDIHFREMDAERIRQIWHKKGISSFLSKLPNRSQRTVRQHISRRRHT